MSRTYPKLNRIGRLRIGGEATYNTESSTYAYFKQNGVDRTGLTVPPLADDYQREDFYTPAPIPGANGGSLSMTFHPFGFSTTVPTDATPYAHVDPSAGSPTAFDMQVGLIASALGNMTVGTFTNDETGSSTTSSISATTLDNFTDGEAFAFMGTMGDWQVGWWKAITQGTPDTATVLQTLADTPIQSGDYANEIFGSFTCFSKVGQPYNYDTSASAAGVTPPVAFSFEILGHDSDDKTVATGCLPANITWTFERGELPTCELSVNVGYFSEAGSGGAPAQATWSLPLPEAVLNGRVAWGTTAATNLRIGSMTVSLNMDLQPMPDVNATGGIGGFYVANLDPTISFSVYRDISEEVTDYGNSNGKPFTAWFGSQPGKIIAFCMPNAYIQEYPSPAEENSAVVSNIVLKPGPYAGDGEAAAADSPSQTPFRVAFL